jgi:hypothetical protein
VVQYCAGDQNFEAWEGGNDERGAHFCCTHDRCGKVSTMLSAAGNSKAMNIPPSLSPKL